MTDKNAKYQNYLFNTTNCKIVNNFIRLDPGVRIIIIGSDDKKRKKMFKRLSKLDVINPNLSNMSHILNDDNQIANHLIFSGNVGFDFSEFIPINKNKLYNYVPQILFRDNNSVDGVNKEDFLVAKNGSVIDLDFSTSSNKNATLSNLYKLPFNNNNNKYITAGDLNKYKIYSLTDIIDFLKTKTNFDQQQQMITLFFIINNNQMKYIDKKLINMNFDTYSNTKISFSYGGNLYKKSSIADYDVLALNTLPVADNEFSNLLENLDVTFSFSQNIMTDENSSLKKNNARIFPDISTDAYTKNILIDEDNRYLFLDYTFHCINSNLQIYINDYLYNNDKIGLFDGECIYFVFKGGNVMNHFIQVFLDNIVEAFNNVSLSEPNKIYKPRYLSGDASTYSDFFSKLKDNFKISDVDYSIYINTASNTRFVTIYSGIVKILAKVMDDISNGFDDIFDGEVNMSIRDDEIINTTDSVNDNDAEFDNHFDLIKKLLADKHSDNEIDPLSLTKCFDYYDTLINNIPIVSTKIFVLIKYVQYLQSLIYFSDEIKTNEIRDNIKNLQSIVEIINKNKFVNIAKSDFYNKSKVNKMLESVVSQLKENVGKKKYKGSVNKIKEYVLVREPTIENIKITKKSDTIIICENNPNDQYYYYDTSNKRYHYTSFNATINVENKFTRVHFDLMRIKFNLSTTDNLFIVNNNKQTDYQIPSEFIDVSIPYYDDPSRKLFFDHISDGVTKIKLDSSSIGRDILINSYGLNDLYEDLEKIIFAQFNYIPWADSKYNKRLIRMIYMGIVSTYYHSPEKLPIFLDLLRFTEDSLDYVNGVTSIETFAQNCKKFILSTSDENQEIVYILNSIKINYPSIYKIDDLIQVKDKYKIIKSTIKFIILYTITSKYSLVEQRKFISRMRSDASLVQHDSDAMITDSYDQYKKFAQILIDYGYQIYFVYDVLLSLKNNNMIK
jgi:hypothetical protein